MPKSPYRFEATMEVRIPWGIDWTIEDVKNALKNEGIETEVTSIMAGLIISEDLQKEMQEQEEE